MKQILRWRPTCVAWAKRGVWWCWCESPWIQVPSPKLSGESVYAILILDLISLVLWVSTGILKEEKNNRKQLLLVLQVSGWAFIEVSQAAEKRWDAHHHLHFGGFVAGRGRKTGDASPTSRKWCFWRDHYIWMFAVTSHSNGFDPSQCSVMWRVVCCSKVVLRPHMLWVCTSLQMRGVSKLE